MTKSQIICAVFAIIHSISFGFTLKDDDESSLLWAIMVAVAVWGAWP